MSKLNESGKTTTERVLPSWYQQPIEQIAELRTLLKNANVYDELKDEFETAAANIPNVRPTSLNQIRILAFYLDDKDSVAGLVRTMQILWDAVEEPKLLAGGIARGGDWFNSDDLSLAPKYVWKPGVRWVLYGYKAYQGRYVADARKEALAADFRLATIEPLLLAAINRNYAKYWSSKGLPILYMSGLSVKLKKTEYCFDVTDGYRGVPVLGCREEQFTLLLFHVNLDEGGGPPPPNKDSCHPSVYELYLSVES